MQTTPSTITADKISIDQLQLEYDNLKKEASKYENIKKKKDKVYKQIIEKYNSNQDPRILEEEHKALNEKLKGYNDIQLKLKEVYKQLMDEYTKPKKNNCNKKQTILNARKELNKYSIEFKNLDIIMNIAEIIDYFYENDKENLENELLNVIDKCEVKVGNNELCKDSKLYENLEQNSVDDNERLELLSKLLNLPER